MPSKHLCFVHKRGHFEQLRDRVQKRRGGRSIDQAMIVGQAQVAAYHVSAYAPDGGPVLVDPDNNGLIPRTYDLAIAALLFHNDAGRGASLPSRTCRLSALGLVRESVARVVWTKRQYAKAYVWRWRASLYNGLKPLNNHGRISA